MHNVKYIIKGITTEDFNTVFTSPFNVSRRTASFIAQQIAEMYYQSEPCAPDDFNVEIGLLDDKGREHWFNVGAYVQVKFNATEMESANEMARSN